MGEILGLGVTHFPPLSGTNADMGRILKRALDNRHSPKRPAARRVGPRRCRQNTAPTGRRRLPATASRSSPVFRRAVLDELDPHLLIWGDDQYENFKEDIIPPYCVMAYKSMAPQPWQYYRGANVWDEPKDKTFTYQGHPGGAKFIATGMLEKGFDVAYAYKPLHHQLGHAFLNTLLFLDYDRKGFPYPVVPFQVNCYGRRVIAQQAGVRSLSELPDEADFDQPCPAPWRCSTWGRLARGSSPTARTG